MGATLIRPPIGCRTAATRAEQLRQDSSPHMVHFLASIPGQGHWPLPKVPVRRQPSIDEEARASKNHRVSYATVGDGQRVRRTPPPVAITDQDHLYVSSHLLITSDFARLVQ